MIVALTLLVFVAAMIVRGVGLDRPPVQVFDEVFYAADGCWYVQSEGPCPRVELTTMHPPLGKWLIGWSIELAGNDPVGWRLASVLAGSLTVSLLFLLGWVLLQSRVAAVATAVLLLFDPMHFVLSRIAMLDIFVTLFGVAAFAFLALDRRRLLGGRGSSKLLQVCAGVALGAAVASKWSGLLSLLGALSIAIAWEMPNHPGSARERFNSALRARGSAFVFTFLVVPALVYATTYVGRLEGDVGPMFWESGNWFRVLWDRQFDMFETQRYNPLVNAGQSPAWSWPLMMRPFPFYFSEVSGTIREVMNVGSPVTWWSSLALVAVALLQWTRGRRRLVTGFVVAAVGWHYLPWLLLTVGRPGVYLFYFLPVLPFLFLAPGWAIASLESVRSRLAAALATGVVALGVFAWTYPLLTAAPLERSEWAVRMWIYDDCGTIEAFNGAGGATVGENPVPLRSDRMPPGTLRYLPPDGWCGLLHPATVED